MAAAGVSFGTVTAFAPMRDEDLDEVARIERTLFDFHGHASISPTP